ncbi:MAG: sugar ABC transporter permease [Bacilli bacterium]|nr:sugar ABC transporter permease [Bacilli bacterium]
MERLDSLEYLHLNKWQRFAYKLALFFTSIPGFFKNVGIKIGLFFKKLGLGIVNFFRNIVLYFIHGDWKTKVSYVIMGFGSFMRGQWLRGLLFFAMEVVFILYMVFFGGQYLASFATLGKLGATTEEVYQLGDYVSVRTTHDHSFLILLYSVLSLFFIVAFVFTWYLNIQQNHINEEILKEKRCLTKTQDDLRALVDEKFYKTLLALPAIGITVFTVLPIIFMILVAFTDFDKNHQPPQNLFGWVGFQNFGQLFTWTTGGGASFGATFGQILLWTLVWAFFATFTNYFLGMMVAMLINKKGIRLKKLWRTILVFSIAIPQFISLLYVSKMFATDGIINGIISSMGGQTIPFWTDRWLAKITVIIINIWIGIPYLMLITTGILMNIPADLYESAKIDGASPAQQYFKITLPYMLFVTGPYLLTSFTGNMNNFNVIFLLTGGAPTDINLYGGSGHTDLLITWLYSLTVDDTNYRLAAVIGILIFIVVALLSTIVYNVIPSTKNEEDFA